MNAYYFYQFCDWAKLTPPELLSLKVKDPAANEVEKLLDDFCNLSDKEYQNSTKYHVSISVKSFFTWNYHALEKASGAVNLVKVKPYNKLTKESLRRLWSYARNMRERALVSFVLSTAVAKGTLAQLQWNDLEENWEKQELPCLNIPPEKLKGHGIGRYRGVRQITFLTPEAKAALIEYKNWIERKLNVKLKPTDNIWLDVRGSYKPLEYDSFSTVISRLSKDSGVNFTWHDARRWVNTAMEQIAISPNWARKIRGRKVKGEEAPYSQPAVEQLRAKYKEAVPLLEFTTDRKAEIEKEKLKEEVKKMIPAEVQAMLKKAYPGIDMRKEVSKPKVKPPQPEERENDEEACTDGKHCEPRFKQIPEAQLLEHLKSGWRIIKEMQNGEVIVTKGGE
jgi:CRISPR/Cas system CSM-associated protein Csm2 small subunit